ncbi:MAG: cytochrome c family protein [Amaricoccus sp.]|nr:cytochrome c family protein [Amaricoccus sp.]
MEITKIVGAFCGSLLVFLLIGTFAGAIFDTSSEAVAFSIPVENAEGGDAPAAEEVDVPALVAAADIGKGEAVFKKCAACHKVDGTNAVGPHLETVVNRPVGSVADFKYSSAMAGHGGTWDEATLFHFLQSPKGFVPGTAMAFAGLPKEEDRANVIAYLASLNK